MSILGASFCGNAINVATQQLAFNVWMFGEYTIKTIGMSVSEPDIDKFAVNFLYISIVRRAVNHFMLVFCVSLRHASNSPIAQLQRRLGARDCLTETRNSLPQQGYSVRWGDHVPV